MPVEAESVTIDDILSIGSAHNSQIIQVVTHPVYYTQRPEGRFLSCIAVTLNATKYGDDWSSPYGKEEQWVLRSEYRLYRLENRTAINASTVKADLERQLRILWGQEQHIKREIQWAEAMLSNSQRTFLSGMREATWEEYLRVRMEQGWQPFISNRLYYVDGVRCTLCESVRVKLHGLTDGNQQEIFFHCLHCGAFRTTT